jgi:hypothetical protein
VGTVPFCSIYDVKGEILSVRLAKEFDCRLISDNKSFFFSCEKRGICREKVMERSEGRMETKSGTPSLYVKRLKCIGW